MNNPDNTSKLMTKRIRKADGATLVLNYSKQEAIRMRALVDSIRLRQGRKPSLSLIARRSVGIYLEQLETARHASPGMYQLELETLERMTAPLCDKTMKKRAGCE